MTDLALLTEEIIAHYSKRFSIEEDQSDEYTKQDSKMNINKNLTDDDLSQDAHKKATEIWDHLGVFLINLDRAPDRMERVRREFSEVGIPFVRVSAIDGKTIQKLPDHFCKWHFRLHYRREIQMNELGCYLSHIKALKAFLESDKEYGLICEDDISPDQYCVEILSELLEYSDYWELVRLHHLSNYHVVWRNLSRNYKLVTVIQSMNGTACYLISRKGAELFLKKVKKISLHFDTTLFRGYIGLREMAIVPSLFPTNEYSRASSIGYQPKKFMYLFLAPARPICKMILHCRRYSLQIFRALRLKWQ